MVQRVRRPVTVAQDGGVVPLSGSAIRIEEARSEGNLYRDLAVLGRSDAAVARAATRWGLLARLTPLLSELVPGLAESLASYREALARDAVSAVAGASVPPKSQAVLGAAGRAMEKILLLAVRKLAAAMGLSPEELADMQQRVDQTDWSGVQSGSDFVQIAKREGEAFRASHAPPGEPQPLWAQDWDAAGDMSEGVDRLGDAFDRLATSKNAVQRTLAVRHLFSFRPRIRIEVETTPEELSEAIEPLLQLANTPLSGSPAPRPPDSAALPLSEVAMAFGLLALWQAGDSLALDGPTDVSVPRLGDVDTWRTVITLAQAREPASGETNGLLALVKPEHAKDWATFASECALWRDAIDATARAQAGFEPMSDRDSLPGALRALERRLVSMQVVADYGRPELESGSVEEARERLHRWIAARCARAGVEPRSQAGLVGTEGRALWSIRDALAARPEARFCRWAECRESLPPGSYANRKWCDRHLRELKRRRTADRRARGVAPRR